MLTIITPTLNAEGKLRHCLESVASQTVAVEHIVVDGESEDATLSIASGYSHIQKIVSEPDRGLYDAMNKGLRMAKGEVIGILNADDAYSGLRTVEKVVETFEDPKVEACYGDLVYLKNGGERDQTAKAAPQSQAWFSDDSPKDVKVLRFWKAGAFYPERFYWGWMPPHPTFFVRRRIYENFGLFNLDLGSSADYELMLRFLLKHRVHTAYIPEILVEMETGGISNASLANRLRANRMDRKAWRVNGLRPFPWTFLMKPLRKAPQFFMKPPLAGRGRRLSNR